MTAATDRGRIEGEGGSYLRVAESDVRRPRDHIPPPDLASFAGQC